MDSIRDRCPRIPGANFGPVGSQSWYLIESGDAIAEGGMLLALVGLHARQAAHYGRLGMAGFIVAFAGTASVLASTVLWLLAAGAENPLIDLLFSAGGLAVLVGFPILGSAIVRSGLLPRWSGWLLVAWIVYFPVIFFALDFYGEARVLFGLVWLTMAWALGPRWARQTGRPLSLDQHRHGVHSASLHGQLAHPLAEPYPRHVTKAP